MRQVYNLIGIAQRAGKISSGMEAIRESMAKKRAFILVMSEDIADNTKEILLRSRKKSGIPCLIMGDRFELGGSIGKPARVALTVDDQGLAQAITQALKTAGREAKTWGWMNGQD